MWLGKEGRADSMIDASGAGATGLNYALFDQVALCKMMSIFCKSV